MIASYRTLMIAAPTMSRGGEDAYYNRLVAGFRAGQLSLNLAPPAGLLALRDPYDPEANRAFRDGNAPDGTIHDLSLYRGKLYLYFGVTPALVLFWPYAVLTGGWLTHGHATLVFVSIGFLAQAALLLAMWRRYFNRVNFGVLLAGVVGVGLLSSALLLLQRPEVWEVTVSCAYALISLAVLAVWAALHTEKRPLTWIAAASLCYGLALGARPAALFGAVVLLMPLAHRTWTAQRGGERLSRADWLRFGAATVGPIAAIVAGLLLYNQLRFGHPLEFGQTYQLAGDRQDTGSHFSVRHFWFNFQIYFLAPARWTAHLPFVDMIAFRKIPTGHGAVEPPWGLLTNFPFLWLAAVLPFASRLRGAAQPPALRAFVIGVALLFATAAATLCLFYGVTVRYQMEFAPVLALLAGIGLLAIESARENLAAHWRAIIRIGWSLLLAGSVAMMVGVAAVLHSFLLFDRGQNYQDAELPAEAIPLFESALRWRPFFPEASEALIRALCATGRYAEAQRRFVDTLDYPDAAGYAAHFSAELVRTGHPDEAINVLTTATHRLPNAAPLHNHLGELLRGKGRDAEALTQFETALRLDPKQPDALCNLGAIAAEQGRLDEARSRFEAAIAANPKHAIAHFYLGQLALERRAWAEAEARFTEALRLDPTLEEARKGLAELRRLRGAR